LNFCCYHVQISLIMSQQTQSDIFHTKMLQMHCGVRLHGQNTCNVIFWNIAPKHWIYMDRGYCNSFYFYLWLYNYWGYVIECVFAVEGHIILKMWLILRILKISSCTSLLISNIEYGDIMIGFVSILQFFSGKFW
jgi:hypothetical protein